jgi:hypothetical protein
MTTVKATVKGRRLELDVPADWPDGIEVEIHPVEEQMLINGDVMTSDEIATTLAAMDQVAPFEMTEEEQINWEAERQARKDREKAAFAQHAEKLRSAWE